VIDFSTIDRTSRESSLHNVSEQAFACSRRFPVLRTRQSMLGCRSWSVDTPKDFKAAKQVLDAVRTVVLVGPFGCGQIVRRRTSQW